MPKFRLADENNRPVYVTPADIDPASGVRRTAPPRACTRSRRRDPGPVEPAIRIGAGDAGLNGFTDAGPCTPSRTRTPSARPVVVRVLLGPSGLSPTTTGGNPNQPEWSNSNFQREHAFIGIVTVPLIRLSRSEHRAPVVRRAVHAARRVGRERRRRAQRPRLHFRSVADRRHRRGQCDAPRARQFLVLVARLPARPDRQCCRANSCTGPWQPAFDIQLNIRPNVWGLDRRLTL